MLSWQCLVVAARCIQFSSVFLQWQSKKCRVSGYYLIYRFVLAALFLLTIVFGLSTSKDPNYWIIYFSHIGLILQTLHLIIAAAVPVQLLLVPAKGDKLNIND